MLHYVVARVRRHLSEPVAERQLRVSVIIEVFRVHLAILVPHHFGDLHNGEKLVGKILWVLVVDVVIRVVYGLFGELPGFVTIFVFSRLGSRIYLGVVG
jgi:hypothetical protein